MVVDQRIVDQHVADQHVADQHRAEQQGPATVDRVLHALADRTRRDIVLRTMVTEQSVSALARRYPVSLTAVQKHVGVLERAGLVTRRRRGREQLVRGEIGPVRDAERVLRAFEDIWRSRVDRFGEVLADLTQEDR